MGKKRKHRPKLTGRQSLEKWLEERWLEERKELQAKAEKQPLPGDPPEADLIDWLFLRAAGAVQDGGPLATLPTKTLAPPENPRKTPATQTLAPRPPKSLAPTRTSRKSRPPKSLAPTNEPRKDLYRWDFGRSAARALVSIMLCDGRITTTEKALVDGILRSAGEAPLEVDEIRIWRPGEVPPPPDVEDVLDALAAIAYADGQRDPGEWRLVLAFGRSWGASESLLEALEERYHRPPKSSFKLLIEALRGYVARARAELAERKEDRRG